jgi:hypothetical protein
MVNVFPCQTEARLWSAVANGLLSAPLPAAAGEAAGEAAGDAAGTAAAGEEAGADAGVVGLAGAAVGLAGADGEQPVTAASRHRMIARDIN